MAKSKNITQQHLLTPPVVKLSDTLICLVMKTVSASGELSGLHLVLIQLARISMLLLG